MIVLRQSPEVRPRYPSPGEDARRHVRHLYAAAGILAWLGEAPGPRPGEPTHEVYVFAEPSPPPTWALDLSLSPAAQTDLVALRADLRARFAVRPASAAATLP